MPSRASELALVAEQLWPGLGDDGYRVLAEPSGDPEWRVLEQHWVVWWRGRAVMVLPLERRAASRCLSKYSRLRSPQRGMERRLWAAFVALGAPRLRGSIILEARQGVADTEACTVLSVLREVLGRSDLDFAMSVRRTANRKALLHLVGAGGATVGFAKLAWNEISSRGVLAEAQALGKRNGGTDLLRTPRVLLESETNGYPFVLLEPLPEDVRRMGVQASEQPSRDELVAIAPVVRRAAASETAHFRQLRERLRMLGGPQLEGVADLLAVIESANQPVPVVSQWHGDFAYWNAGRTSDGTLWCWDFENAGTDVPLGLDVLHWHASQLRTLRGAVGLSDARALRHAAVGQLEALGVDDENLGVIHRVYILETIVRALEMATSDGWATVWATPTELSCMARSVL